MTASEIFEAGYLIDRGVRLMAIVGTCEATEENTSKAMASLNSCGMDAFCDIKAIPFVVNNNEGRAVYGWASHAWVIDLFKYAIDNFKDTVNYHRILGLLLGYNGNSIREYEERFCCSKV